MAEEAVLSPKHQPCATDPPGIDLTGSIRTVLQDIGLGLDEGVPRHCYAFAQFREIREGGQVVDASLEGVAILFVNHPLCSRHQELISAVTRQVYQEILSQESSESSGSPASQPAE